MKRKIDSAISTPSRESDTLSTTTPSLDVSAKPRLPKLSLPKFRGDVTCWSAFWDSYRSAVHENSSIAVVDKFNYLNSLLEGPAARTIQGLTLNESNYDSAVRLLKDRFGRPQQIISAHMEELLKISPCVGDKSSSLRYVYDKINVNIRGLSTMGITSAQYGSLLIPIIMTKLTPELRLRIARESRSDVWEIGDLLTVIKQEVEAREATEMVKVPAIRPMGGQSTRGNPQSNSTASALVAQNSSIQCVYCNGPHYSASCTKVTSSQERKEILQRSGRCFNCLKTNHKSRDCDSRKTCRYCHRKHHQSICSQANSQDKTTSQNLGRNEASQLFDGSPTNTTTTTTNNIKSRQTVLLQTAQAMASRDIDGSSIPVRVLFDSGSQLSYITERLQDQLHLKPFKFEKLHLNTFGTQNYKTQACAVVRLYLKGRPNGESVAISALTSPVICSPLPSAVKVDCYPHLSDLRLADESDTPKGEIDVLIGSNCYWSLVTGEVVKAEEGPVAVQSKLGWLLSGPIDSGEAYQVSHSNVVISGVPANAHDVGDDTIFKALRDFWEVESLGIVDTPVTTVNPNSFMLSISYQEGRYTVNLPWKYDHADVPNHLVMCESRLRSLLRKLQHKPDLLLEYDKIIQDQLKGGIVEMVNPDQLSTLSQTISKPGVHYMPHHGVTRQESQTTKLRIVYNGSARAYGGEPSVNDCLQTGPNYIPKLFDILVRFRWHQIAVTADIEKAFLMISVAEADRDFLRFLWVKDPFKAPCELIHLRFTRLVFGLRPSPAILGEVLIHHLDKYQSKYPELIRELKTSFYVDDLVTGASDEKGAIELFQSSREIMLAGGMNLRKWKSNSPFVMKKIASVMTRSGAQENLCSTTMSFEEEDETYTGGTMGHSMTQDQSSRILGVIWDHVTDTFQFEFTHLGSYVGSMPITKRSVLKLTAKIFDPLGFVSPFVIQLKILFQLLCQGKLDWDVELSGELLTRWKSIISELNLLEKVRIPRCYFSSLDNTVTTQLHGFCDASEQAFAAVIYIRSAYVDGTVEVALVASKTRVSPIKKQSIPRLELLGAVILGRLMKNVISSLPKPVPTFYWTDSMATLHWIRTIKPWKQYVSHRVFEIHSLSNREQWQHCPGCLNPADIPSRGMKSSKLADNEMWWTGPSFLKSSECRWPRADVFPASDATEAETIKNSVATTHVLVSTGKTKVCLSEVIDCAEYSSFNKLLRVTAYVLKFLEILRQPQLRCCSASRSSGGVHLLTGEDFNKAELFWMRSVQTEAFAPELLYLESQNQDTPPIRVSQFGLFVDRSGLLRCQGRINNAQLSLATKNPVLLPSSHQWVKLLIQHVHDDINHSGTADTLATLREKYWILKGRQTVKKIINSCINCNKLEGPPYPSSVPPDLPGFRTSEDPPFTNTGADFAGPLFVKEHEALKKAYVCLFTCCSTRAVHLELVPDLSVNSFLLAFRRFVGRRGLPVTLITDNAKTFRTSSKEFLKIARSSEVNDYLGSKRVTWRFIVERAPWWGGFYERLVRSVKRSLRKSIGRSNLTFDQLCTLLVEIEGIINSRPVTYLLSDQEGVTGSLSPSHLINGRRVTALSNSEHFEIVSTHQSLTQKLRHHKHLLNQFTKLWRRDYLLNLRENHNLKTKRESQPKIKVGDIVVVKSDTSKRLFWKLAIVDNLLTSTDGNVRAANVRVSESSGNTKILRRSVKHLFPIEVGQDQLQETHDDPSARQENHASAELSNVNQRRPRREAALVGEQKRRNTKGI